MKSSINNIQIALDEVEGDLSRFKNDLSVSRQASLRKLESSAPEVCDQINTLKIRSEERLVARKGRFNLFTTLLNIADETRLHSRFIEFLLNPSANHDCGNLFLKCFLEVLEKHFEENNQKPELSGILADNFQYGRVEKPTKTGRRIDIYLEFAQHKIAIENKIWAVEQPNQILDYGKSIESDKSNNLLFYLTLDGKDATSDGGAKHFCISYREIISIWLDLCLTKTYEFVNINQALQQYRAVVQELTGQSRDHQIMNEITEIVRKHSKLIEHFDEITAAVSNIKNESISGLLKDIKTSLDKESYSCLGLFGGCLDRPFDQKGDTWIKFESKFESEFKDEFYLGYSHGNNDRIAFCMFPDFRKDPNSARIETLCNWIRSKDGYQRVRQPGWWGIWFDLPSCKSFRDSEFLICMLNKEEKKRAEVCQASLKEIVDLLKVIHSDEAKALKWL